MANVSKAIDRGHWNEGSYEINLKLYREPLGGSNLKKGFSYSIQLIYYS